MIILPPHTTLTGLLSSLSDLSGHPESKCMCQRAALAAESLLKRFLCCSYSHFGEDFTRTRLSGTAAYFLPCCTENDNALCECLQQKNLWIGLLIKRQKSAVHNVTEVLTMETAEALIYAPECEEGRRWNTYFIIQTTYSYAEQAFMRRC